MMRLDYDPQVDAVYLGLSDAKVVRSRQVEPGVVIDFDKSGGVVGIEVFSAKLRQKLPRTNRRARKTKVAAARA